MIKETVEVNALKKIQSTPIELSTFFKPSPDALTLMQSSLPLNIILKEMIESNLFPDAINILAHGLPKKESIGWAYQCAQQTEGKVDSGLIQQTLLLVDQWIKAPDDKVRRALENLAEKLELKVATAWVAYAVFWSGGSIAPEGAPQVMPNEFLYAKAVAGAVMLSAVLNSPEQAQKNYRKFLTVGIEIANREGENQ